MATSSSPEAAEPTQDQAPLPPPEEGLAFTLDLGLSRTGDAGSAFHTTNDLSHPLQRSHWTMRKTSALDVRIVCLDVIHGLLAPDSTTFCTLLVLEFRFDPRKQGRRIASADVELVFQPDGGAEPVVAAIAPEGRLSMAETEQDVETTYGAKAKIGGSPVPAVSAGAAAKWERTVSKTTTDATRVIGSVDIKDRTWGKPNCASWTLLENETTKTGIPASMRAAVLLHRADEEKFKCVLGVKVQADWKSNLAAMTGSTPRDDPVLFDPTMASTNKLRQFDELVLGSVDLEELADITFATVLDNATKRK